MQSTKKKLILAAIATISLCVTAVSTTFAWFSMNDSAWVDEFKLDIQTTDHLLIGYADGEFKQSLNKNDVVRAINNLRDEENQINDLSDISLSPVTSFDGSSFQKQMFSYNELNQTIVSYVEADKNSYVQMRLYFSFSTTTLDAEHQHPEYELHFKKPVAEQDGIKATSFKAENQALELINTLVTPDETKKNGDVIVVNPVNALRLGVKSSTTDIIIDYSVENDLGSYAFSDNCQTNAMYTYFNNVHNNCLKPMDEVGDTDLLKSKLQSDLDASLGTFTYDLVKGNYNTIMVDVTFWIEGFDADNLIGLKTAALDCLLSFTVTEKETAS
ncbi:MAG: hypothetical protein K2G50_01755 [Anaeroplasmataceae bacterium]|nr:hypothetical protein [Anaeroplasmataceae bacterium]